MSFKAVSFRSSLKTSDTKVNNHPSLVSFYSSSWEPLGNTKYEKNSFTCNNSITVLRAGINNIR